jgi:hypothetical protein
MEVSIALAPLSSRERGLGGEVSGLGGEVPQRSPAVSTPSLMSYTESAA